MSATWKCIIMDDAAPSQNTSQCRSPRFGTALPLATSYSTPFLLAIDSRSLMLLHIDDGMTVSHAPESAITSMSIHSVGRTTFRDVPGFSHSDSSGSLAVGSFGYFSTSGRLSHSSLSASILSHSITSADAHPATDNHVASSDSLVPSPSSST